MVFARRLVRVCPGRRHFMYLTDGSLCPPPLPLCGVRCGRGALGATFEVHEALCRDRRQRVALGNAIVALNVAAVAVDVIE